MKTLKDERYIVIKAYKFTVLRVFSIIIYCMHVRTIPRYRVYQHYDRTADTNKKAQHFKYPLYVTLPQLKSKISCLKNLPHSYVR